MNNVQMQGFMRLTRMDTALEKFFNQVNVQQLSTENVASIKSLGRILSDDVIAAVDVPFFDRSAVDGYAVRAEATYGASRSNPVVFDVLGMVEVGLVSRLVLKKQQTVRIATGAVIPDGSDSVVMVENAEQISEDKVEVYRSLTPGENVSRRGEDVRKGETILHKGRRLQPQDIGILAAMGQRRVNVVVKPRIGILSTGNELVDLGAEAGDGKIIDSNRLILMAMATELGGNPVDLGIARDNLDEIQSKITIGMKKSDIVLVSGGSSVGAGDLAPKAINNLGTPGILVHGISIRPGKPTALAAIDNKPIVLLPGFPVAAMVSFYAFVQPILMKMLGAPREQFAKMIVRAKMSRRIPSHLGNRTFARVIVKQVGGSYVAEPLRTSGSGVISSMIRANGIVVIPEEKEGLEDGEEVEVTLLRPLGD